MLKTLLSQVEPQLEPAGQTYMYLPQVHPISFNKISPNSAYSNIFNIIHSIYTIDYLIPYRGNQNSSK